MGLAPSNGMVKDYYDILERARGGPKVGKQDWDLEYITLPVRRLVKRYTLACFARNAPCIIVGDITPRAAQ